jgi:hypothetical protein
MAIAVDLHFPADVEVFVHFSKFLTMIQRILNHCVHRPAFNRKILIFEEENGRDPRENIRVKAIQLGPIYETNFIFNVGKESKSIIQMIHFLLFF